MIDLAIETDHLVITVVREEHLALADLVEKITPDNRHNEVMMDTPQGRELI